ncbi:hypothetical protein [Leptothermofonsia sichuanensis]|nr:hypothetical protein [Leptothermofonsia sichuanensis]
MRSSRQAIAPFYPIAFGGFDPDLSFRWNYSFIIVFIRSCNHLKK